MEKENIMMWSAAIFGAILILVTWGVVKGVQSAQDEYEQQMEVIGKQVVWEGDTLTIIDMSTFNETYTLSDGSVYNYRLFKDQVK